MFHSPLPRHLVSVSGLVCVALAALALGGCSKRPPASLESSPPTTTITDRKQALAQELPPGFQETLVLSGRRDPTALRFAPNGQVFVAEKSGLVWVYDSITNPGTARLVVDLRVDVHNFWDRGLLGLAVHPNYPATPQIFRPLFARRVR